MDALEIIKQISNLTLGEDVGSVSFKSNKKTNKKIL